MTSSRHAEAEVCEIGPGDLAYLQPDGSWGLSNAGLVIGARESLMIDTLFDLAHTRRMLEAYRAFRGCSADAELLVNTHANGDHCFGNVLLPGRRMFASRRAAVEMVGMPPKKLSGLMKVARLATSLGTLRPRLGRILDGIGLRVCSDLLVAAPYVVAAFARFEFENITFAMPNELFEGELEIDLGSRSVRLIEVGPAHTEGDVVAFVPDTRTLYAGDLLFEGIHPLVWGGTLTGYEQSLTRLLALEPVVVVPGHGALTDSGCILRHINYLRALRAEAEPLYLSGATAEQAALVLMRQGFGQRREPERLAVNVAAAFREFSHDAKPTNVISLFASMARLSTA